MYPQGFPAASSPRLSPRPEKLGELINPNSLETKSRARNEGRPTIFLHPARLQPHFPLLLIHHGILPTDQRGFRIALVGALVVRRMRLHVRQHRRLVMRRWGLAIQGVGIDVAKVIDFRVLDDGESAVLHLWTGLVVAVAVWRGGSRRRHRCRFSKQVN